MIENSDDLPQLSCYSANASTYHLGNYNNPFLPRNPEPDFFDVLRQRQESIFAGGKQAEKERRLQEFINSKAKETKVSEVKKPTRRLVRVIIADPDESLPLDKAILLRGEEQLTDLTDEELFLEIGIKPMLDHHNGIRAGILDKRATAKAGKDVFLEPIRVRQLKMVVSTIAEL